jgi:hypothetical protein
MKRIAVLARLVVAASMVILAGVPMKAGAAGVYENAAAEPAFLLSARRTTLRGDLDFSRNDPTEASIYRVGAAFPLRNVFMLGVEQTFVSVTDSTAIKGGIGDLYVRASARVWRGNGRAFLFLGYLAAGTTKQEYFPYSSETFDISTSLAYVDSLGGAATIFVTAGRTWVNRSDTDRSAIDEHADNWRGSAGVSFDVGPRVALQGGALAEYTVHHAERWIPYGRVVTRATDALLLHASFQKEVGDEDQRVSDWAASAGFTVLF